jgi:hypothetical protein
VGAWGLLHGFEPFVPDETTLCGAAVAAPLIVDGETKMHVDLRKFKYVMVEALCVHDATEENMSASRRGYVCGNRY